MDLKKRIEEITGNFIIEEHISEKAEFNIIDETEIDGLLLTKIRYNVDQNDKVPAYIIKPKIQNSIRPGILALHQTTKDAEVGASETIGLGGEKNYFYALELAHRGYTVIAPDYPFFGNYSISTEKIYDEFGYQSVTMKGIMNHIVALNVLQSLEYVDKNSLGCIGHSLGGTNTLFLTFFDKRIRCAVVSAGFTTFERYELTAPSLSLQKWAQKDKYMPLVETKFQKKAKNMPFDFPELLASLAPTPLFLSTPLKDDIFDFTGAKECIEVAQKTYRSNSANDKLVHYTPDCLHDFPTDARLNSYNFLDKYLRN